MNAPTRILILLLATLTASCAIRKDLETPFTDVANKPIVRDGGDSNGTATKYCAPGADGKYDAGAINMTNGMNGDGSAWAEGGGCVIKPIREVWAALSNQPANKWDEADSLTFSRAINPTTDFTHLYTVTYSKSTILGEIDWTMEWYHGFDKGTFLEPMRVNIIYGRTAGTSNIPIWSGGITLTKLTDTVTSIEIHNNFKARQSDSDNTNSSEHALNELVNHARTAAPDWTSLNTGFKDNPSQPDPPPTDDPTSAGEYCVKDTSGNYPTTPTTDTETNEGVSVVTVRSCIPTAAAALYQKLQNPVSVLWKNASTATATQSPSSADTQVVAYSATTGFFRSVNQWTQDWTYKATPATTTTPENYLIEYKMDPATTSFPVWQGSISITAVDANESAIEIQNNLLLDSVSASPAENTTLAQGLLSALTPPVAAAPTPAPAPAPAPTSP